MFGITEAGVRRDSRQTQSMGEEQTLQMTRRVSSGIPYELFILSLSRSYERGVRVDK